MPILKLVKNKKGKYTWKEVKDIDRSKREKDSLRLTIDQLINRDGGILSHADNKVYSTKKGYLDSIKSKGYEITS